MKDIFLSAIIIAKNEEKNIERCLKSINPVVDEIVLVDTGSSDNTKKIAAFYTENIFDFEWNDNFSDARNFAISKANGKILFSIDADEAVSEKDYEKFETLKKYPINDIWGITLPVRIYTKNPIDYNYHKCKGEYPEFENNYFGYVELRRTLIFPKNKLIKFNHIIHESVEKSISENNGPIHNENITIHNFGYDKHNPSEKEKFYEKLLFKELNENPNNFKVHFDLGLHFFEKKDYQKSLDFLMKSYELSNKKKGLIAYYLASNYFLVGKIDESEELLKNLLHLNQPGVYYYLSRISLIKGEKNKSLEIARKAIRIFGENPFLIRNLADIYKAIGNKKLAKHYESKLKGN